MKEVNLFHITEISFLVKLNKDEDNFGMGLMCPDVLGNKTVELYQSGLRSSEGGRDDFMQPRARSLLSNVNG